MSTVDLSEVYPCLQILKSVTSLQGDMVTFNMEGRKLTFYSYDKSRELQIFGQFNKANTLAEDEGDSRFIVSLTRFITLLRSQKTVNLSFGKNGLSYSTKGFKGSIEALQGETIEYPKIDKNRMSLSKLMYDWVKVVKLNTLFKKEDMFVFIKYDADEKAFKVSCADNYHTALLTASYEQEGLKSFSIALPIKYIDYANKLIADATSVAYLHVEGDDTYFFNKNMVVKAPTVDIDAEQVNIDVIIEHTKSCKTKTNAKLENVEKIKQFLRQSKAIAEEDKDNQVKMSLADESLQLFTETKHGQLKASQKVKTTANVQVTVNSKALLDLVGNIDLENSVNLSITENAIYMSYATDAYRVELTTIGTSDGS